MEKPMPVSFTELSDAVDFVSAGNMEENRAYLCKESGKIYHHSELVPDLDELPEDVDDEERYLRIPDRRSLDLGKPLALDFAREFLPDDFDQVRDFFRRKGAYAKFKNLVARRGVLDRWYDFETKAQEQALREWCEDNLIEIVD
jgi:Uncharacterised protein family (UPF0158)